MLRTGKQMWEANAKRAALAMRQKELEFHIERLTSLSTNTSVLAGFAFSALAMHTMVDYDLHTRPVAAAAFFIFGTLAMALALYTMAGSSCLCVAGHQVALLGSEGDAMRVAVHSIRRRRNLLFGCAFMAMCMLVCMAIANGFVRQSCPGHSVNGTCPSFWLGEAVPWINTFILLIFLLLTFWSMHGILSGLLDGRDFVTGTTKLYTDGGVIDLATLQPGQHDSVTAGLV